MGKGKRKFVLENTETDGLTEGELTRALSRLAGHIHSGRCSLEGGALRDSAGKAIGTYKWVTQLKKLLDSTA